MFCDPSSERRTGGTGEDPKGSQEMFDCIIIRCSELDLVPSTASQVPIARELLVGQ